MAGSCPWDENICANAAVKGPLDVLVFLRDSDCPWNEHVCAFAAKKGHLDVLVWAIENRPVSHLQEKVIAQLLLAGLRLEKSNIVISPVKERVTASIRNDKPCRLLPTPANKSDRAGMSSRSYHR